MHLIPTTQILLLASSSLLTLTSAGPLPTTTATAIATSTDTTGSILPSANNLEEASHPGADIVEKRQRAADVWADEDPGYSDGVQVIHDPNPAHDMIFSDNIGP